MFAISLFYYAGAMMIGNYLKYSFKILSFFKGFFIFRFLAVFIFSWAIDYSWTTSTIGINFQFFIKLIFF